MVTALVCGSRTWGLAGREATDPERDEALRQCQYEERVLDAILATDPGLELVTGDATGADSLAAIWARDQGVPCTVYRADWKRYGRAAGPMRNRDMLRVDPQVVLAFSAMDGRGTGDMLRQAQRAGVATVLYPKMETSGVLPVAPPWPAACSTCKVYHVALPSVTTGGTTLWLATCEATDRMLWRESEAVHLADGLVDRF
jgi:hypothetical protein